MRIWHHRHLGPLLTVWGVALAIVAAMYWMQTSQPALRELLEPLYYIVLAIMLLVTWRWFRVRGRKDRRHGDRRHTDRRGTDEDPAGS